MEEKIKFLELDCISLGNDQLQLLVATEVGPRIIALFVQGENIFAELPKFSIECPGKGPYRLWGGHRLWYAPEVPERTYLPDDQPVEVALDDKQIRVTQRPELDTGIQKSIRIKLAVDKHEVVVDHQLTNLGRETIHCAPWAITQLRPGGRAILPMNRDFADAHGVQPNRSIALWPYTDVNSDYIIWGNDCVLVESRMSEGALKIGFPNPIGWLAYYNEGILFVKKAEYRSESDYYDLQSSSQCYCNDQFLELETLGPKAILEPGRSIAHRETWELFADIELPEDPKKGDLKVAELLQRPASTRNG